MVDVCPHTGPVEGGINSRCMPHSGPMEGGISDRHYMPSCRLGDRTDNGVYIEEAADEGCIENVINVEIIRTYNIGRCKRGIKCNTRVSLKIVFLKVFLMSYFMKIY